MEHLFYFERCNSQFCVMHETPQKMQNVITMAKDVCLSLFTYGKQQSEMQRHVLCEWPPRKK